MNQFEWVDFYKEFADKLLEYKNKRNELIELVKTIYRETGINMPTLEIDNKLEDIDPFTVFGLFNKSSMRAENRIKIISFVKELFGLDTEAPETFDSIPVLNNQNATFYSFADSRKNNDIDDLWDFFESALEYAKKPTIDNQEVLSKFFDIVINKKGNGNSKVTMGLYWIAPDSFLNLDSRNEWFIYKSGKLSNDIVRNLPKVDAKIQSIKYFEIIEKVKDYLQSERSNIKDFKELSLTAWKYSNQINKKEKEAKKNDFRNQKGAGLADEDVDETHYWIYSPGDGASRWEEFYKRGVMGLGWSAIGNLAQYESRDEMKTAMKEIIDPSMTHVNGSYATWQFLKEIKIGDVVFAKRGRKTVIGKGIVTSDYIYDTTDLEYPNIRKVDWVSNNEYEHPGQAVMKTLTDITVYTDYVKKLNDLYEGDAIEDAELEEKDYPVYTSENFLEEVYMDSTAYNKLVELIRMKKNVILQGAPGVGKTFVAKRLAYSMMGCKDQDRVMMVQFHQSYTYEDFIEGFRPSSTDSGFEIKKGAFYNFCKKAAEDLDNEYFFIIDEINRGNMSKIFGELFMLIENDKRGNSLQLLYSDEKFFVPANVYIVGMMNTADRSLAMLDYALRRRFAFFEMKPAFSNDRFKSYKMNLGDAKFNRLIDCIEKLNDVIAYDDSLGEGFCIGHSYFCNLKEVTDAILSNIIEYEIIPLLKEYWFDEPIKVRDWTDTLRSSIK